MSKQLIKGLLSAMALGLTQVSMAGYVGDPIAMDAPYDLNYYPEPEYQEQSSSKLNLNPSQFGYEFFGPMSFHNGGGRAKVHTAYLYAHLIEQNPEDKFSMGLDLITRMTWLSTSNNSIFESERLYTFGLNGSASYSMGNDTKLFFGASALMSTDFDTVTSHCVQIGARGGISHRFSDRFSMQLGVYYSPQLSSCPVLPIIGFRYQVDDRWYIQLDSMRLRAINKVNDSFSWGPFVGISAGSWNVKHERRDTRLSMISGIAGLQGNIALGKWGKYTPTLTGEVGCAFANNFQYRNATGRHKRESVNADPGLYVQLGVKLAF